MKVVLAVVLAVSLLVASGVAGYLICDKVNNCDVKSCCKDDACVACVCPCTQKPNVLRWVKDPNLGTLYYGWYEPDGSAFNYVATATRNHRMGNVPENPVPAHKWVQVD